MMQYWNSVFIIMRAFSNNQHNNNNNTTFIFRNNVYIYYWNIRKFSNKSQTNQPTFNTPASINFWIFAAKSGFLNILAAAFGSRSNSASAFLT